jgi:hypothetical protein
MGPFLVTLRLHTSLAYCYSNLTFDVALPTNILKNSFVRGILLIDYNYTHMLAKRITSSVV